MAKYTQFEVQVFQNGRWSIHAQFPSNRRDAAIEEAKKIEKTPSFTKVKVIREVYDSDQGGHKEFTVYKGPQEVGEHKGWRDIGDGRDRDDDAPHWSFSSDDDDFYDDDEAEDDGFGGGSMFEDRPKKQRSPKKPKQHTIFGALVKMLVLALASLIAAGSITIAFALYFSGKELFGVKMVGTAEANAVFLVFVGSFLLTATLLAVSYFKNISLIGRSRQQGRRIGPVMSYEEAQRHGSQQGYIDPALEAAQDAASVRDWLRQKEDNGDGQDYADDPDANERSRGDLSNQASDQAATLVSTESVAAPVDPTAALSAGAEKQKAFMMRFLAQLMEVTGGDKKKLDNFTKFGINLFLAGACEALATAKGLQPSERARILSDSVQVLGFKKSHAGAFAERYEEYLMQDYRYMSMFQAGRNALSTHLSDGQSGPKHLQTALKEWDQPKQKHEQVRVVAVMFTDIAGSTALTQQLGDAGAQEVVRAHNKIVREALTQFNGKEVKHTGDGMMMSFDQTTNAVMAAMNIQKEVVRFRQSNPDKPLQLKIGINAGEPISEDNDLFGTTVQLAARIVDKAKADQIFVSDTVKGLSQGKGFQFASKGNFAMKGFSDKITLYEVIWRQAPTQKAS